MDMPPVPVLVLDALADGEETVETMRGHGEVPPYGLALIDERLVVEAVESLLNKGHIAIRWTDQESGLPRCPDSEPPTTFGDVRTTWFRMTDAGAALWRKHHGTLDAYFAAHPPGGN